MFLHYGITHAPPLLLAGVSLVTFAAGLLLGTRLDSDTVGRLDEPENVEQ